MVLCNISRQENITDPSRSERRCENANAFYQDSGALPNQINSPMTEQSRNQSISEDRSDTYHLAQDKLFGCSPRDLKLRDELTQVGAVGFFTETRHL